MPLHELKKVQLHELSAQDSIGRLQMLCMSVLLLSGAVSLNGNAAAHRSALKKR